jgi:exoribonuclease R
MKSKKGARGGETPLRPGKNAGPRPGTQAESWEGALAVHPRGFGFVTAAGHDDLFVPFEAIGTALHGDRVRATLVARTFRGAEGRIEEVVKRRSPRVAGTLRKRRGNAWLEPDDTRIRGPIVLGTVPRDAEDGAAAVATITRFPDEPGMNPEGDLVEVLGAVGDPNVEVAKILVREQIVPEHSAAAMREAEAMAARLGTKDPEGRRDLRHVPFLTIDLAIVYSLVMWAVFPHLQPGPLLERSLIIFPAAGVLWGLAVWFWTERQYVRFKKSTEA